MVTLRALWRMFRVLVHLGTGLWMVRRRFPHMRSDAREAYVQHWSQHMLRIVGVALEVQGTPPTQGPMLLVANHISWLDIWVLHACGFCRFVSKAEVHHWPVVGALAQGAGTLFIERASRRDALRVVHHMAQALQAGDVLAVFPEGTTGDGHTVLPFHANLLQSAIAAHVPVMPVALRFVDLASGNTSLAPSYVGDESLLGSMWRTLSAQPLAARVHYGQAQLCAGQDRRQWAAELRSQVIQLQR